jgi:cobalamin biosynthetic protein CobC
MDERVIAHGGDLDEARRRFPDAPEPWIDLSTGINPIAYPLPPLDPGLWSRLPSPSDLRQLEQIAGRAYHAGPETQVIAAPGTQSLIQVLPRLVGAERVGILETTYQEHAAIWLASGARVATVTDASALRAFEVGIVVNPNNPDGRLIAPADLISLAQHFSSKGGLLVLDEAFMDVMPDESFASLLPEQGVVVLRSFGKMFGLAGLRLGFALTGKQFAGNLRAVLGPWPVSGPGIEIGCQALVDHAWQLAATQRLTRDAARLDAVLQQSGFDLVGGTPLFRLARSESAQRWFERLGESGIHVRRFEKRQDQLRFGLPGSDMAWERLANVLANARQIKQTT